MSGQEIGNGDSKISERVNQLEEKVVMGKKGRLHRLKPRKKSTKEEISMRSVKRAADKLSQEVVDNFVAQ